MSTNEQPLDEQAFAAGLFAPNLAPTPDPHKGVALRTGPDPHKGIARRIGPDPHKGVATRITTGGV